MARHDDRLNCPLPTFWNAALQGRAYERGVITPLPCVNGARWPNWGLPMSTVDFCPCR